MGRQEALYDCHRQAGEDHHKEVSEHGNAGQEERYNSRSAEVCHAVSLAHDASILPLAARGLGNGPYIASKQHRNQRGCSQPSIRAGRQGNAAEERYVGDAVRHLVEDLSPGPGQTGPSRNEPIQGVQRRSAEDQRRNQEKQPGSPLARINGCTADKRQ